MPRVGAAAAVVVVAIATCGLAGRAIAEPKMLKGPYLQNIAPTSITVMWQLAKPAPATVTVTGPSGAKTFEVDAAHVAEAALTELQPSTRYRYRVEAAGGTWDGEFATAPPNGKDVPFTFVVMGDTRNGTEQHRRVIERMSQEVPDFVLGTGDMVDEGWREEQWQQFFDVESALLRDNVLFPAVGNHDRQGRGQTADTYRAYFSVPENGSDAERNYAFTYATSRFLVLDSNEHSFALTDQTAWLERELTAARQDAGIRHVFVVMHHPPFSISLHGGQRELRDRWTPLFEKYQVTAVFSGHDHVYTRAEHNGIHYFVSGGGGAPLYPRRPAPAKIDLDAVKHFERVFHYLRVSLTSNRVEVTGVRADGTTIESTTWTEGAEPVIAIPKEGVPAVGAGANAGPESPEGHPSSSVAPTAVAPDEGDGGGSIVWIGLIGVGALLGVALVVVRTLRK